MDTDRIEGAANQFAGRAKEAVGAITNDDRMRGDGYYDQAAGAAKEQLGRAKETVTHNPISSIVTAGLVGLVVGFILGRS
ncbi:CsbD family protein [Xanthobacteraceae bacterium A53D]